jgi:hypothetical protein
MTRNTPTRSCGINNVGKLITLINQQHTWSGHYVSLMLSVSVRPQRLRLPASITPKKRPIGVGLALGSVDSLRGLSIVELIHLDPFLNDPRGEVADTH